ncbi:MAG: iron transporter, partial [Deltaproteobacteria bacterium]|nr:iron transporter [Deltaproteobacteria bacterium]
LPLIIGVTTGPAGAVAAMVILPFTKAQLTLMAIFILICHSLPQETAIQAKSGFHPLKAVCCRLTAAFLTVAGVAFFLDTSSSGQLAAAGPAAAWVRPPLGEVLLTWLMEVGRLAVILLVLITVFMTILEVFRVRGWINPVVRFLSPLLRALGLNPKVGLLWVAAAVFGLAYGAGVLVEEAKSGRLDPKDLEALHLSVGINHGLLDDPALFLSLGLNAFWIYVPRLIMAVLAVRLLTLWRTVRKRRALGRA